VNLVMPDSNGEVLITSLGFTSLIGRIAFGLIADSPKVNRISLQQLSFTVIGLCTMLLVLAPVLGGGFGWMVALALLMGVFDGCFISLLGPIAFDICGAKGASQAIKRLMNR